jgi:hypothetical protein
MKKQGKWRLCETTQSKCRAKVMDRQVEQVGMLRGGDINRPQRVRMRIKLLNDGSKLDNLWSGPNTVKIFAIDLGSYVAS